MRYWVMALAVLLGGVTLGALIITVPVLLDGSTPLDDRVVGVPFGTIFGATLGGVSGFAEGFVLAIPLPAALGLFAERG